jgi:hypothetical protein
MKAQKETISLTCGAVMGVAGQHIYDARKSDVAFLADHIGSRP